MRFMMIPIISTAILHLIVSAVLEKGRNMITEMVIGIKSYSRLSTKSVKSTIWQRWTWIKYARTERKKRNASGTRVKMVILVGMI